MKTTGRSTARSRSRLVGRRAFTLVELLVVISIIVLLLAMTIPAFTSMTASASRSLAENMLQQGLTTARDAAVRNGPGQDAACVFFFEPGGRVTMVACTRIGTVLDADPLVPGNKIEREVFAPISTLDPQQMPREWGVRGYAPRGLMDTEWYEKTYADLPFSSAGNWLFPETGFYDSTMGTDGGDRQTFMVRFQGGTGLLDMTNPKAVLVLAVSPSSVFRTAGSAWGTYRADLEADPARFVRRVMATPPATLTQAMREQLVGGVSTDTVLAKPVGQLSLYNEKQLASALGLRLDDATLSIYRGTGPGGQPVKEPQFVADRTGQPLDPDRINQWIEQRLKKADGTPVESEARVFTIQRYLGLLQEFHTAGGV